MDPIDPPSRTTLFLAGGSGSSSSDLFESSFDSGCPPDYTGANCFTSSLPSCTPPPPKSPSPITGRMSRASQGRRASDGGPRLLFCQQGGGDRPTPRQRSIQGNCLFLTFPLPPLLNFVVLVVVIVVGRHFSKVRRCRFCVIKKKNNKKTRTLGVSFDYYYYHHYNDRVRTILFQIRVKPRVIWISYT